MAGHKDRESPTGRDQAAGAKVETEPLEGLNSSTKQSLNLIAAHFIGKFVSHEFKHTLNFSFIKPLLI